MSVAEKVLKIGNVFLERKRKVSVSVKNYVEQYEYETRKQRKVRKAFYCKYITISPNYIFRNNIVYYI